METASSRRTEIESALNPLFDALPFDRAMPGLVPVTPVGGEIHELAEVAVGQIGDPALAAGIWLYVDDLDRSHQVSQNLPDATGAFWHGIMHRREGDFANAKYWFRQAGRHPAMETIADYDPFRFVDEVAAKHRENPADLVEVQRTEWKSLFGWCLERK